MRFFARDQSAHFAVLLREFKRRTLSYESTHGFPETVQRSCASRARYDLRECDLGFLFRYHVFPPAILKFLGEWELEGREMRVGDTIVQQAQFPPAWGMHFVFGSRVVSIDRSAREAGFSYGTLRGHPEIGINAFSFVHADSGIDAVVRTRAIFGRPLSRLLAWPVTRPYVRWCNRRALAEMLARFTEANA